MAIEIVDFPIQNGGSFHSFLLVYQRVWQSHLNDSVSQWAPHLTSIALQLQQHHILQGVDKGASTMPMRNPAPVGLPSYMGLSENRVYSQL